MSDNFNHGHDSCYDCCNPNQDSCELKPNCGTPCCSPLPCGPADIQQAHCVPIIAQKIFDCVCIDNLQFGESDTINGLPIPVTIENYNPLTMLSGMPICIDKVSTHIDSIGLPTTIPLSFKVGTQSPIIFEPITGSTSLATDYQAVINTSGICCKDQPGAKTRIFSLDPLIFSGVNGRVTVTGKIGCACFRGHYSAPVTFEINDNFAGIYPLNLFSKICLPKEQKTVNLGLSFTPVLTIECVTPTPDYTITVDENVATFTVSAEYSFLVNTEITASTTEKLGVFVSDTDIKCHSGNNISNCSSI